jgi:hypothetical protein
MPTSIVIDHSTVARVHCHIYVNVARHTLGLAPSLDQAAMGQPMAGTSPTVHPDLAGFALANSANRMLG